MIPYSVAPGEQAAADVVLCGFGHENSTVELTALMSPNMKMMANTNVKKKRMTTRMTTRIIVSNMTIIPKVALTIHDANQNMMTMMVSMSVMTMKTTRVEAAMATVNDHR